MLTFEIREEKNLIEHVILATVLAIITDNPQIGYKELSEKLGWSERNLYRYLKKRDMLKK